MPKTGWPTAILSVAIVAMAVASGWVLGPASRGNPHVPGGPGRTPVGLSPHPGSVEVAPAYVPSSLSEVLGELPVTQRLTVAVGLAPLDPSELSAYLLAEYAPGSTTAHHYQTTAELANRYGSSATELAAALQYFASEGLSVTVSPDHLLLLVNGPATDVGRAFGTSFVNVRDASGRTYFTHLTPAVLPAGIPWTGALGLGDASPITPAITGSSPLVPVVGPASTCTGNAAGLTPCQVWTAYNMTSLVGAGTNGTGFRIGVVDPYSSDEQQTQLAADLASYSSRFGLPAGSVHFAYPVPTTANLNASGVNTIWGFEDALDLQWAHGSAPGAAIDFTFSPDAGVGLYEAIDWLVSHQAVDVISLSWGEPDVGIYNAFSTSCSAACNASTDGSYGILSPVLQFAAAEGISVFAATGDCGSADGTSGVSTHYPASDPTVTAVGGTVLDVGANGSYYGEQGWSGNASGAVSPGCTNQGGSGGGYAPFPRPWWQTGLPAQPASRGSPDVALVAGTPAVIVYHSSNTGVAGTSLATPIWAGIAAVLDQASGQALGFLNPSLYRILNGPHYSTDFHDIISGSNGYSAGPGWDPVTGIGTPLVAFLAHDIASTRLAPSKGPSVFLAATPSAGAAPLTVSLTLFPKGGSGRYPLEGVNFDDGTAGFARGNSTSHTFAAPGVYAPQAYVVDSSGNLSLSPPAVVIVGGGSALTVTLAASSHTPSVGSGVTFTTTVAGGTSPYAYSYYFGDGTFLNHSTSASVVHAYGSQGGFCAVVVVDDSHVPIDGGNSSRVGIAVGGSPPPDCGNATGPLALTPSAGVGVRDAPAEFPSLFSVSGGVPGDVTLQYVSSDPYVAACECTIFRASGNYSVFAYANDSAGQHAVAETNVTVGPSLLDTFSASAESGPAPLTVNFTASASGGYGVNTASTAWTFGNGARSVGARASATYSSPGFYVARASLEDQGHGNASEAFLLDVFPPAAPPPLVVTGTIAPADHLVNGSLVHFAASAATAAGAPVAVTTSWDFGEGNSAYGASVATNYFGPLPGVDANTLNGSLTVFDNSSGANLTLPFSLPSFFGIEASGFLPRASALGADLAAGPINGTIPFTWLGSAIVRGPGSTSFVVNYGDENATTGSPFRHIYSRAGNYTAVLSATDSLGDSAVQMREVTVFSPLSISGGPSSLAGSAPLRLTFAARAAGGVGAPYGYAWSFGDGTAGSGPSITHTYGYSGTFAVVLNVSDRAGHLLEVNWTITVTPAPSQSYLWWVVVPAVAAAVVLVVLAVGRRRKPPTVAPSSP